MDITLPPLTGRWVRLEPLAEPHREPLRAAADDARVWEHMTLDARGPGFDEWWSSALAGRANGRRLPMTVIRLADNAVIGSTSYLDVEPAHRRVEIGATWYRPDCWATAVNPECKFLLLAHAFDALGLNRVALVTDVRNARSQAAIAKLGAVREGVLRAHMVTRGGRVRDSVVFGITSTDWPAVKAKLTARFAAFERPA